MFMELNELSLHIFLSWNPGALMQGICPGSGHSGLAPAALSRVSAWSYLYGSCDGVGWRGTRTRQTPPLLPPRHPLPGSVGADLRLA